MNRGRFERSLKQEAGSQNGMRRLRPLARPLALMTLAAVVAVLWFFAPAAIGQGQLTDADVAKIPAGDQPIAFSHKIHAGDNQIDCQYCHIYARRTNSSGVPPVAGTLNIGPCSRANTMYSAPQEAPRQEFASHTTRGSPPSIGIVRIFRSLMKPMDAPSGDQKGLL